jgi:hypothetical protein
MQYTRPPPTLSLTPPNSPILPHVVLNQDFTPSQHDTLSKLITQHLPKPQFRSIVSHYIESINSCSDFYPLILDILGKILNTPGEGSLPNPLVNLSGGWWDTAYTIWDFFGEEFELMCINKETTLAQVLKEFCVSFGKPVQILSD